MKHIYLKTMELLKEVNQIKYIDRDKGQLERWNGDRPPVNFPCALIKIALPRITNRAPRMQTIECTVTVRIAFDYSGETSSIKTQQRINDALAYYDTITAVVAKLQGWSDEKTNRFQRTAQIDEDRSDGLNVVRISFLTGYLETIAS